MPSTYSPDLRIELIERGQQTGIWGTTTNNNLGTLIEQAIAGAISVNITNVSGKQALTAFSGVADQSRNAAIILTTSLTAPFEVYVPPVTKLYVIRNTSAYTATIYASTILGNTTPKGDGIAIPAGTSVLVRCDGTNILEQLDHVVGDFSVGGTVTTEGNQIGIGSYLLAGSAFLGASAAVTISVNNPAVFTTDISPANGTAVRFDTSVSTNELPGGLSKTTTYYVLDRTDTTFNVTTTNTNLVAPPYTKVVTTSTGTGPFTVYAVSTTSTSVVGTNNTQLANTQFVTTAIANLSGTIKPLQTKEAVRAATVFHISSVTGERIVDGVSLVAGDRVLLKNQYSSSEVVTISTAPATGTEAIITVLGTPPANGTQVTFTTTGTYPTGITISTIYYVTNRDTVAKTYQILAYGATTPVRVTSAGSGTQTAAYLPGAANGIYIVKSGTFPANTWVRADDADTSAKLAGASVPVLEGTFNGGKNFTTTFKSTSTLNTTAMEWSEVVDASSAQTLINKSINATQLVNASITAPKLNGAQTGIAPIYAPRAFASFSANPADMVTTSSGFVCTGTTIVITEVGHSYKIGQCLYLTFSTTMGTGFYGITAVTANTFTVVRQSGSSNISGSVSYSKNLIYSAGNVAFVSCRPDYPTACAVNFLTPMPSSYFAWSGSASSVTAGAVLYVGGKYSTESPDPNFPPQAPYYVIATAVYGYQNYPPTAWNINFMSVTVLA